MADSLLLEVWIVERSRLTRRRWRIAIIALAALVAFLFLDHVPVSALCQSYVEPVYLSPIAEATYNAALDDALAEWKRALGKEVKRPEFVRDARSGCSSDFAGGIIACADAKHWRIMVRSLYYADPKTVLMHEIGHLLGVPHIEGDPLMDSVYSGVVPHPTRFAVAIAKSEPER